jgi:hypothetical protein
LVGFNISCARIQIFVQHLLPALAAVRSFVDSALRAGPVISSGGYQNEVGIPRIDHDAGDDVRFAQADVYPGRACVG